MIFIGLSHQRYLVGHPRRYAECMKLSSELSISPDDVITRYCISKTRLEIDLEGAFYDGEYRSEVRLVFDTLSEPTYSLYDSVTNHTEVGVDWEDFDSICEFHRKMDVRFSIQGFGAKSGKWISLGFGCRDPQIFYI